MSSWGAGRGWGRLLGGNCGTGVRASILKPTPFIYLAFDKKDLFIYLIIWNDDLFIYCPLIFCTHLLLVVRQISQSIHWIPREQAATKNLWAKTMCIYHVRKGGGEGGGSFHIGIQKNRVIHILFVEKKGSIIFLAALKKGFIRHAHPYYYLNPLSPRSPPPTFLVSKGNLFDVYFTTQQLVLVPFGGGGTSPSTSR